jgi:hypothetical protein
MLLQNLFILLAGELMKIPSSELRIQICKCIIDFYHSEPPKKHIPGEVVNGPSAITVSLQNRIYCLTSLLLQRHFGLINVSY